MLGVGEVQRQFLSLAQAILQEVTQCYLNPNSGFANFVGTLQGVLKAATDLGVERFEPACVEAHR